MHPLTMPTSAMHCSFGGGGWISQEFVLLVVASVIGLLLAPVLDRKSVV